MKGGSSGRVVGFLAEHKQRLRDLAAVIAVALILSLPRSRQRSLALTLFAAQLALNFAWSPVFFGMGLIDWALLIILAMNVLVTAAIIAFWPLNRVAALLLVPYLAWLCLATVLNFETGKLNPGADRAPLPWRAGGAAGLARVAFCAHDGDCPRPRDRARRRTPSPCRGPRR